MNRLIELDMPVTYKFVDRDHIRANVKLDRLPDDCERVPCVWFVSVIMMFVHVSASMSVLPPRLASLYCLVPIGMSMRILQPLQDCSVKYKISSNGVVAIAAFFLKKSQSLDYSCLKMLYMVDI